VVQENKHPSHGEDVKHRCKIMSFRIIGNRVIIHIFTTLREELGR